MNPSGLIRFLAAGSLLVVLAGCNSGNARSLALADSLASTHEAAVAASQPGVLEDEIRNDLYYLASDRLQGRGVGTEGLDLAADYIATRFEALGLKPLPGMNGYFQPFEVVTAESIAPETALSCGETKYKLGKDFTPASFSAEKAFDGPVVFAGYGIANEAEKYDDYAGLDVKGKAVLILRFEPHDPATGTSRWGRDEYTEHSHLDVKARNAQAHGAAAVLMVNPPKHHFSNNEDPLLPFVRQPTATLSIPFLHITRQTASDLLKRGGAPELTALQDQIDKSVKPHSSELKDITVKGKVAIGRARTIVKNVVAYVPGSGPTADEYIVVGSHYDHLGWGGPSSLMNMPVAHGAARAATNPATLPVVSIKTTTTAPMIRAIHHGADDNASGTVAMLELARIFSHRAGSHPPARSIIFCAFTAEESGLIGSARFVKDAPLDLKKIAAMINFDMVGRVRRNMLYVGGGGTAAPLKNILKVADLKSPLEFKNFGDGGLGPSDHMSFAIKKIPVLFLFSGNHEDYHRPTDTADKVNFDGIAEVVRMSAGLIDDLAEMSKSRYVDAADKHSMMSPMTAGSEGNGVRRASLGVVPEYGGEEDGKGVKIGGASAGTPAEKAGLQAGDVVVQLGGQPTGTLMELAAVLSSHKPGDKVKLIYRRGDKEMTAEVTLAGR